MSLSNDLNSRLKILEDYCLQLGNRMLQNTELTFKFFNMLEDLGKRIKVVEEISSHILIKIKNYNELNCQLHKNEIIIAGILASIFDDPISITSRILKSISRLTK